MYLFVWFGLLPYVHFIFSQWGTMKKDKSVAVTGGDAFTRGHTDEIHPTEIVIGEDATIMGSGSTDKEDDSEASP